MLKTQERYIDFLQSIIQSLDSAATLMAPKMDSIRNTFSEMAAGSEQNITQTQLLVPVTGAFSAGKSSLLNALLQGSYLPVAITPETALATELHYDPQERIEAITHTGEVQTFDLSSFAEIAERAREFEYLRACLAPPVLKDIAPLVLVDMPGFNSPLDAHNKAILNFIDRGAHYVVLVSVEEGGLTTQTLRRMQDILDNGRSFSICLSKTDLRTPAQVQEIADHVSKQLESALGLVQEVVVLDQTSAQDKLQALIDSIDLDQLVRNLFGLEMKEIFLRLDADLNTLLATLGKSAKDIQDSLADLRSAQTELTHELELQVEKLRESGPRSHHAQSVLDIVRQSLEECTEGLVLAAMTSQEALTHQINDIVQGSLVGGLRKAHGKLAEATITEFARALEGRIRTELILPPDMMASLINHIKDPLLNAITPRVGKPADNKGGGLSSMAVTGGLVALAAGAAPLLALAITIVPGVVDWLLDLFKDGRQREQIRQALRNQVYPDITRQLRPQVEAFLLESMENAVAALAQEYEQHLERQRAILADAERECSRDLAQLEDQRKCVVEIQALLRNKAETAIFAS